MTRAVRILILLTVTAGALHLASSCSGGCSRSKSSDVGTPTRGVRDSACVNISDCASALRNGGTLSPQEADAVLPLAETDANRLGAIVDELQRNDDPADTYNVLAELDTTSWISDLFLVTNALSHVGTLHGASAVQPEVQNRALQLSRSLDVTLSRIKELEASQLNHKKVFHQQSQ